MQSILLCLIPLFPALAALVLGLLPLKDDSRRIHLVTAIAMAVNFALCVGLMFLGDAEVVLFSLGENLPIALRSDLTGRLFLLLCGGMWLNSGVFSPSAICPMRATSSGISSSTCSPLPPSTPSASAPRW